MICHHRQGIYFFPYVPENSFLRFIYDLDCDNVCFLRLFPFLVVSLVVYIFLFFFFFCSRSIKIISFRFAFYSPLSVTSHSSWVITFITLVIPFSSTPFWICTSSITLAAHQCLKSVFNLIILFSYFPFIIASSESIYYFQLGNHSFIASYIFIMLIRVIFITSVQSVPVPLVLLVQFQPPFYQKNVFIIFIADFSVKFPNNHHIHSSALLQTFLY